MEEQMFAIGYNELEQLNPVKAKAKCPRCGKKHEVKYGEKVLPDGTKEPSKLLGYVKCGKDIYLVAVAGKELSCPTKSDR